MQAKALREAAAFTQPKIAPGSVVLTVTRALNSDPAAEVTNIASAPQNRTRALPVTTVAASTRRQSAEHRKAAKRDGGNSRLRVEITNLRPSWWQFHSAAPTAATGGSAGRSRAASFGYSGANLIVKSHAISSAPNVPGK